jgi:hypothetical protein
VRILSAPRDFSVQGDRKYESFAGQISNKRYCSVGFLIGKPSPGIPGL